MQNRPSMDSISIFVRYVANLTGSFGMFDAEWLPPHLT